MYLETMPRFSRRQGLRPVNRIKHVVDKQDTMGAGVSRNTNLVETVDAPVIANTQEVITGSTVNAIYLKLEATATSSAALANVYMYVAKNPGGNLTLPAANVVGANDNKKYIIHQEMVMMQKQTGSNPRTIFNGVIVIPRGYRRFGPNDLLLMTILAPGVTLDYCLQCHYKEFR